MKCQLFCYSNLSCLDDEKICFKKENLILFSGTTVSFTSKRGLFDLEKQLLSEDFQRSGLSTKGGVHIESSSDS